MWEKDLYGNDKDRPSFASLCICGSRYEKYRRHFISTTYPAGECIQEKGTEITRFGIVTAGILKTVSYSRDGEELCNAYFGQGDSFPEFLYLSGNRSYTYLLFAEKKASVLWIPIKVLEEMLENEPELIRALLRYVSERGLKNQLYLNCLNYQTVRERIAYWAVGIQNLEEGAVIRMPLSQRIFANMLHVNRSSLNQELKQMEREGYFSLKKEEMFHVNRKKLEEIL